jgi:hypothetical protein
MFLSIVYLMEAGNDFANVEPFWKTFSIYGGLTIYMGILPSQKEGRFQK